MRNTKRDGETDGVRVPRRLSRGDFLRLAGAAGVAGSTLSVLSACSVNTTPQSSSGGGGGGGFNLYNWADYVAESTVPGFEEEFDVSVTQDFYSSNEELLAKLQAGGSGYDLIVPSDYMVTIMRKSGVIQELDLSRIPNFENVGQNFRGLSYDPQNNYSVPYQWGTTGILYNRAEVGEVTSWETMWDPRFEGGIAMLDDVRETLGAALMSLGYSINSTNDAELEEARQLLVEQGPLRRGFFASTEINDLVERGDIVLGHVFSGDGIISVIENENLDYAIPEPAATRWTDNMCIPSTAANPELAHDFINYILDADVGAALTNYTYYGTPNEAAEPALDEELTSLPFYSPPQEVFDRLQIIEDLGEKTRDYERIFTAVKSA